MRIEKVLSLLDLHVIYIFFLDSPSREQAAKYRIIENDSLGIRIPTENEDTLGTILWSLELNENDTCPEYCQPISRISIKIYVNEVEMRISFYQQEHALTLKTSGPLNETNGGKNLGLNGN